MSKLFAVVLSSLFAMGTAFAQSPPATTPSAASAPSASSCEAKAVGKSGKPLAGAAKASFVKKCQADSPMGAAGAGCEAKAVGKAGKPLAGAAKASFVKKCQADAVAGK